jgi:hypothetical protein
VKAVPCWRIALALLGACGGEREPNDAETGSSGGDSSTTVDASSSGEPEESSSSSSSSSSGGDESSEAPACDPMVPGEFQQCADASGNSTAFCGGPTAGGGVPSCLLSFFIEGASTCTISGCVDACDCFAPPATGTAPVACITGIVADDTACVLDCNDGQQCPDGMVCGGNICVWALDE